MSLGAWIDDGFLAPDRVRALREEFAAVPRRPLSLPGFLRPERARALTEALSRVDCWERARCLRTAATTTEVDAPTFEAATPEQRFSRHDVARPLSRLVASSGPTPAADRQLISEFFEFLAVDDAAFRGWLGALLGHALNRRTTCEVVRYHQGDFIAPHADTHDGRVVGVNFYLDAGWSPDDGGLLCFEGSAGPCQLEPRFNQLTLIPIDEDYRHEVQPWRAARIGRYVVSLSYGKRTKEG
jgi:hypothetical protein